MCILVGSWEAKENVACMSEKWYDCATWMVSARWTGVRGERVWGVARCCLPQSPGQPQHHKYQNRIWWWMTSWIFFASSNVNYISKSVVTAMRFTIDNKHLIKWMWVKTLCRKALAQDVFWQKMKFWWGTDTDQNISARPFTLLCGVVSLCGRPQPEHESVMPLLSLSPLNV